MDETSTTRGNGCGKKSEEASPQDSPRMLAQIETTPTPDQSQLAAVEDKNGGAGGDMIDILCTKPPASIPLPTPGMSLPAWLKLVIKPDYHYAISQFDLLQAYHSIFHQPHIPNEGLTRMVLKIFGDAEDYEEKGKLWILHVRWLWTDEAAAAFEAGHGMGGVHRVSKERRENAARVMDFLLTVGDGKLPKKQDVAGEEAARTAQAPPPTTETLTTKIPPPPPPPPEESKPAETVKPEPPRKQRDLAQEFQNIKDRHDNAYHVIIQWLCKVFVEDQNSHVDSCDIKMAYDATNSLQALNLSIDGELMAVIICEMIPGTEAERVADDEPPIMKGLRWKELERPTFSVAIPYPEFPEKMRNEAHKLLHIPDPERTRLWLKMCFTKETDVTTSLPSLWEFYERVFWRWADTHPYLQMEEFFTAVQKTFRSSRRVEVSPSYHILHGVRLAEKHVSAKAMLAYKQKRDLRRLQDAGQIDAPKSAFARKLLDDPLLMRPRRDFTCSPISGSFVARTRRRGGDATGESRERQPLGDEEPGFPGLSMKRAQVRYKSELEEYDRKVAAMQQESDKKVAAMQQEIAKQSGLPTPDPNAVPRPPGHGITYVD